MKINMILDNFGIQLYSVRDDFKKEQKNTLSKLAEYGYKSVEFAGFFDVPADTMLKYLDDAGLKVMGCHSGLDQLGEDKLDELIEYNLKIGNPAIILPWAKLETADNVASLCENINIIGEKCRAAGLRFGYHNHKDEFNKIGEKYIIDLMMEQTDPQNCFFELDTGWSTYAGADTCEFIRQHSDRIGLIHLKQLRSFGEVDICELRDGIADFPAIVKTCREVGIDRFIVEQDRSLIGQMISAKDNADYLLNS
jgi:sugar phosphate isomerase/epimerase